MKLPYLSLSFWHRNTLPVLLQTEASECGLACLTMAAIYWGHQLDLPSLRRRFSLSLKGATLKGLMTIAQGLNLQSRPLKLELEHLQQLKLPAILHWNMNHFVVLRSVTATHAVVHDPAVGRRRLSLQEFSKHFTGVAVELTPMPDFKRIRETQRFTLASLMGHVVGLRGGVVQLMTLGLMLQVCVLIAPFYMQWLVDDAIIAADRDLMTVLGCGFLLLVLLQTAITGVRAWATMVLSANLNMQWLGNAFIHLMKLPLPYFEKRHSGDIVSRFGSIQTIQRGLTTQFIEGLIDGTLVISTLAMMLLYSGQLTLIACTAVLLYVLLRISMFSALREASAEQIIHAAKQQTHFLESVRGIQSIRLFGRSEERTGNWLNTLADQFNAELRVSKLGITYQTLNTFLFNCERVIVIWLAGLLVVKNAFSVGMLFAFISYKDQFSQRMASLVDKLFEIRMMRLHGERVADILLTEPEQEFCTAEMNLDHLNPTIEFRNVTFRYSDQESNVLDGLDLRIPAGQCVAITGPSGCGKTTLMKLILGLIEPTSGEVLVAGQPLKQLGQANFRQMLGTVMQDDSLFAGSVADNISFFDPKPEMEQVVACAQLAAVHQEISAMPMGYQTLIGDLGSGLSGGQKQRILLARALYRKPRLLLLDEATSHLDVWNEQVVNHAIRQLSLTRVIVAHRPETIAMAERVVVLQRGRVAQDVTQTVQPMQA